ncbi:MAG TPA: alpha/beta hydrolase [Hyphomicrobiaceae bacterium]|nr:alpha/beta hydrolase [Hyphomicrobiaceae bacterium]
MWHDLTFSARDGLRLYARHYPAPGSDRRPVLCLAGLTRNSRDFHRLAMQLTSGEGAREVYTLDARGRGRSEHDRDWANYSLINELNDALDFLTMLNLHGAAVIGTARGGLIAMLMAVMRPSAIGAAVLNDIGPVIEREGLTRIIAYIGRVPVPADWTEATHIVYEMNKRQFPAVPAEDWEEQARAWFNNDNGLPVLGYDPNIAKTFSIMDGPIPDLWPQFGAMMPIPVLAIRGEHSDILSVKTLEEMRARHPHLDTFIVRGQGHAPLLRDGPTISAIQAFLARSDSNAALATSLTALQ